MPGLSAQPTHSLTRYAGLIDCVREAMLVADADGRVVLANDGAVALFGVARAELLRPLEEYADCFTLRGPEGEVRVEPVALRALLGNVIEPVERSIVAGDGTVRHLRASASPLRDADGAVEGALVVLADITRTRQIERAAVRGTRYRAIVDAIPQIAWTARPDGRITFLNARWTEFSGRTAEVPRAAEWADVLHPDEREDVLRRWHAALASDRPFELELRLRRRDGVYRWHLGRGGPLRDASGAITTWIGTATDIDDAKLAEAERAALLARERAAHAEAETANRMKDEFLATLSHELRTPLSAILGWATMLRGPRKDDPKAVARGVEVIERNARAQQRIIEDILDMSRIVRGELRIDTEPVELEQLAREVQDTVRPSAEARAIALRCRVEAGPHRVLGDPLRLRQVLWNLLSNAVKFTPPGGEVEVVLARVGGEATIEVRDSGCGIDASFLPHVFERFRQADSSTTRVHGGLGLGLAIVRHLVEMHGGTVEVSSPGPGRGATFRVRLPGRGGPRPPGAPISGPHATVPAVADVHRPGALLGARVLLVEDEADAREYVEQLLRGEGAEVRSAGSADAALAALAEFTPDVLLCDLGMPGRDGLWLVAEVRRRLPALPTVALTAYARREDVDRARAAGFDRYLVKPVDPERLFAALTATAPTRP